MNNNYFGPILKLRRSTDSAIQDFFINSAGTAIGTLPNGTGTSFSTWLGASPSAYVETWYDQSGQGNHTLFTGSTAEQPLYELSTNSVNCSGSTRMKYPVIKDSLGVALAGDINVSLMCKLVAIPTTSYPFSLGTGGLGKYTGFFFNSNTYGIESGQGGGGFNQNASLAINDVFTAVINTKNNVKIYRSNGSVQRDNGSGIFGTLNILQTSTVANSNNTFSTLKYSAVCVFNTNISDNDRIAISSVI